MSHRFHADGSATVGIISWWRSSRYPGLWFISPYAPAFPSIHHLQSIYAVCDDFGDLVEVQP